MRHLSHIFLQEHITTHQSPPFALHVRLLSAKDEEVLTQQQSIKVTERYISKMRLLLSCLLVSLVSSLSSVAAPSSIVSRTSEISTPQTLLEKFHAWADKNGVERKVEIQEDTTAGGGRGLIAMERIEPGDVAARVPLSAVMKLDRHPNYDEDDQWAGMLASRLQKESQLGDTSAWAPYISTLPKEAPSTPCRWTSQQRRNLQNETFVEVIQENSEWRKRQWQCSGSDDVVDYMKWLDLVCSRTLKGRDGSRQLVPLIDIANHAPSEAGGGHFAVTKDAVYLKAGSRGVNAGQAVTMDYGARNVDDFLLHYGFVPHRCVSDAVSVEDEHTIQWGDCQGYRGHPSEDVREASARMLASYPTTLEEDVALLNSEGFSEAELLAANYRYAKKSLLSSAVGMQESSAMFRQAAFV